VGGCFVSDAGRWRIMSTVTPSLIEEGLCSFAVPVGGKLEVDIASLFIDVPEHGSRVVEFTCLGCNTSERGARLPDAGSGDV